MNWCQLFGYYFPDDSAVQRGITRPPQRLFMPFHGAKPASLPPLAPCKAMHANCSLRTCDGVGGPRPTYLGCACSNRTAIAGNFRSQHSDENFVLERVCRFVSRLLLGHSFGASPAPSGTWSPASHSAPLGVTVPPKTSFQGKERRANFFRAPPRKQTFDLGSRAHSLRSVRCDPTNNGKIQQTETTSCTRTK
jgi:hypothetical protein